MPIYEYQCVDCGHRLEAIQKISDDPLKDCPECGKTNALKKLVSAAAFKLKGSGWYETDFKDKNKPAVKGEPDKKTKTSEKKSSETKSDTAKTSGTNA